MVTFTSQHPVTSQRTLAMFTANSISNEHTVSIDPTRDFDQFSEKWLTVKESVHDTVHILLEWFIWNAVYLIKYYTALIHKSLSIVSVLSTTFATICICRESQWGIQNSKHRRHFESLKYTFTLIKRSTGPLFFIYHFLSDQLCYTPTHSPAS